MNVKDIRRKNLRSLARAVGGVTELAEQLERSQSQISHLIGTNPVKNIGDRLATHVEKVFNKPHGWLDQLHSTHEDEGVYQVNPARQPYYQVPILTWQEAQERFVQPEKITQKNYTHHLITSSQMSPHAFALKVEGDSMETAHGPSFPHGSIIVLDPEYSATNNSFVVAKQNASSQLVFKQLVIDGNRRYLKPLNTRYPLVEITAHAIICGVVRLMMIEFK